MNIYLGYLKYVIRHKWFVLVECWKMKLYWRGLIHDWHKFLPDEFIPFARHFRFGIQTGRDNTGYYKPVNTGDPDFDLACLRHRHRADHHWQYWITPTAEDMVAHEIPINCVIEMFCDWIGAGKAQKTKGVVAWYKTNKDKMILHPRTREFLEMLIGLDWVKTFPLPADIMEASNMVIDSLNRYVSLGSREMIEFICEGCEKPIVGRVHRTGDDVNLCDACWDECVAAEKERKHV